MEDIFNVGIGLFFLLVYIYANTNFQIFGNNGLIEAIDILVKLFKLFNYII